ncbi:MAG: AAA family ATPase [Treponema sp.]
MNDATLKYCKEFIESKESPHFAILLKGKWGVGKTYFIEKLIKKYPDKNISNIEIKRNDFLKISLFGITSIKEINDKMLQEAHPIVSKTISPICKTIVSAFSNHINVDLSHLNRYIKSFFEVDKKVLIIDDIERAEIPISQIFGYFSNIISETDVRVIFVGNEEKIYNDNDISKNDNDISKKEENSSNTDNSDYNLIKEKTIGMEFLIWADIEDAVNSFIKEFNFKKEKDFIKEKIKEISSNLECENLRIMRQSLYNLNILLSALPKKISESEKQDVISYFLILFIQKSLNLINEDVHISKVLKIYDRQHQSYKAYQKEHKDDKIDEVERLLIFTYDSYGKIPFFNLWKEIIFSGNYDQKAIVDEYNREKEEFKLKQQKPLFELSYTWHRLSKEQFEHLVKTIQKDMLDGKYLELKEILHYSYQFIIFSTLKLIPESINDIKIQVDKLISKYRSDIIPIKEWTYFVTGYEYPNKIPELNDMRERFKTLNDELLQKSLCKKFNDFIKNVDISSDNFIKIIINADENNKFDSYPILSFIDIKSFYNKLSSLSMSKQSEIIGAFEKRYGIIYGNKPFYKEYANDFENLKELLNSYTNDKKETVYDPQELLKRDIIERIEKLVKHFQDN